ncbi:MAG: HDIG domain-containing protein [Candidatus Heimdallarchaeota archaeon]|nr:MAG: HDIG domain-containing protein [Candidatus Heimdallarchaeota archaeon]
MTSFPNYFDCIQLLLDHSTPLSVISHLILTTQTALDVTKTLKKKGKSINCDLILAGALLHDIGRSKSHRLNHGIIGAQILQEEGFPEELSQIAEHHLFSGITKYEARDLGLPFQNYLPRTLEEKIITYADNISKRKPLLSIDEVIQRYSKYIDKSHPILKRVRVLHTEVETLLNDE